MSEKPVDRLKTVLKNAEIKRAGERLTKKELCNIYGFNYNFYMNCISGRNIPSQKMADSLEEYLATLTQTVYEKVFAFSNKDTNFHEALNINPSFAYEYIEKLKSGGIYKEPKG